MSVKVHEMTDVAADLKAIAQREDALYAALIASEAAVLEELFADALTYVHPSGILETKGEHIAGQSDGLHRHGAIHVVQKDTRVVGDVGITTSVVDVRETGRGEYYTRRYRETLVWVRESGTWRLLVRHASGNLPYWLRSRRTLGAGREAGIK